MSIILNFLRGFFFLYRILWSPFFIPHCRFSPTCSAYAEDALRIWGWKGIWLIFYRLKRCHPWGTQGWDYDPVPSSQLPHNDKEDL